MTAAADRYIGFERREGPAGYSAFSVDLFMPRLLAGRHHPLLSGTPHRHAQSRVS